MGLDARTSWLGILAGPIPYLFQHRPLSEVARDYYRNHSPRQVISRDGETEEGFKVKRQQWVDGCAISTKSVDVGYSKANASQACAQLFDSEPAIMSLQNALASRAGQEVEDLKVKVEDNQRQAIAIIFLLLFVGVALYLLISK